MSTNLTTKTPHLLDVDGYKIDLSSGATSGQALIYNGTSFVPQTPAGAVSSVSNSDGSVTISPTTGAVVASLPAVGTAGTYTNGSGSFTTDAKGRITSATSAVHADATHDGYLLGTDWTTFNSKLSANQSITLSGDISGTGATAITTTIGAGKVTNAMLAGGITNANLANSSIVFANGTGISGGGTVSLGGTYTPAIDTSAALTWTATETFQTILPSANNTYSLGSSSVKWKDGYFAGKLQVDGYNIDLSGNASTNQMLTYNGTSFVAQDIQAGYVTNTMLAGSIANAKLANSTIQISNGTGISGGATISLGGSATLSVDQSVAYAWTGDQTFHNIAPVTNNTYSLGTSSLKWADGYFAGKLQIDGYNIDLSAGMTTSQVLQYNGTSIVAATAGGSSFYQTVQANTTPVTQRANLNFGGAFSLADSSGSNRTTVSVASAGIGTNELNQTVTYTFTNTENFRMTSIGTGTTVGISVQNNTAAAAGTQQYSPVHEIQGRGWKTDATAASQTVSFGLQTRPVQGTANPTGALHFLQNINAAGYSSIANIDSTGKLTSIHFAGGGSAPTIASGAGLTGSGSVALARATDAAGVIQVTQLGNTAGTGSATLATITYNTAYGAQPKVVLTPANANAMYAGANAVYVDDSSSSTSTMVLKTGTNGLSMYPDIGMAVGVMSSAGGETWGWTLGSSSTWAAIHAVYGTTGSVDAYNTAQDLTGTARTLTWSHTTGGTTASFIVFVATSATVAVPNVYWNNAALTLSISKSFGQANVYGFTTTASSGVTANVVVSVQGEGSAIIASSYSINNSSGVGTTAAHTGVGTNATFTTSDTSSQLMFGCICTNKGTTFTPSSTGNTLTNKQVFDSSTQSLAYNYYYEVIE